ncbi:MAG: hypothetical protein IKH86_04955 [Prevotella sp.]|nr:hypothetical protein [Prevotella sp.]
MNKKFAFILPYIGKLPDWFQLWLNSCARNPMIDWLLFTDDHSLLVYPENVKVSYCSFDELKVLFQKNFEFSISLQHPYRFCDYKPAYGEIFKEFISGYEFWGHCDPDLIWGNLGKWLSEERIACYDRISHWGHCSLYRNTKEMNTLYKKRIEGISYYKDVYSYDYHIAFDEEHGMNIITREQGIKECIIPFFDVKPAIQSYGFTPTFASEPFFPETINHIVSSVTDDGVMVYGINSNGELVKKEFAYIHLQKRKMKIQIDMDLNDYIIVPNRFISSQKLECDSLRKLTPSFYSNFLRRGSLVWKSRFNYVKKSLL